MKKLTLAIFLVLAAALGFSQGPPAKAGAGPAAPGGRGQGRRMDPKQMLDMMTKNLKLTPAQVKQLKPAWDERSAAMDKLRAAPGDRNSKMPQMKKLRDAFDAKMKKILTKDQQAAYEKQQAEMRARFGGGRGAPGAAGGKGGPPKAGGI